MCIHIHKHVYLLITSWLSIYMFGTVFGYCPLISTDILFHPHKISFLANGETTTRYIMSFTTMNTLPCVLLLCIKTFFYILERRARWKGRKDEIFFFHSVVTGTLLCIHIYNYIYIVGEIQFSFDKIDIVFVYIQYICLV